MHGCKSCSEKHKRLLFGATMNEMDPLFCGWRDPRTSSVSGWTFGSALLGGTRISALCCPCGVQFSQHLCAQTEPIWQNQKEPCNPKLSMIMPKFNILCVLKHSLHQIYTQGRYYLEQSVWGLGKLCTWNFPKLQFYEICYMWSTKLISQFLANFSYKLTCI